MSFFVWFLYVSKAARKIASNSVEVEDVATEGIWEGTWGMVLVEGARRLVEDNRRSTAYTNQRRNRMLP